MSDATTRLGFVGIGRHATRLRDAFLSCGARVEAYDRKDALNVNVEPAWGKRVPWHAMVWGGYDGLTPMCDAVVCCAPPDVTAEVAEQCARSGKRLLATKPLLVDWDTSQPLGAVEDRSIYVDLWRLYSPAWLALKAELRGKTIRSVHVDFYGNGPVRSTHSGLLDYGPHALAFVLDLGLRPELVWRQGEIDTHRGKRIQWFATGRSGGVEVSVSTGNGWQKPVMHVRIMATDGSASYWLEDDKGKQSYLTREPDGVSGSSALVLGCDRDLALRNFCRAFLAGEPSDTLRISCEAMRMLRQAEP